MGSLWHNYSQFVANGSNIKQAAKFDNVVNIPLITGAEEQEIISIFNFPELHVLTGIVGKLIKEFEKQVFASAKEGKAFIDSWFTQPSVNISRTVYHGSASFKGNMARKLLKLSGSLAEFTKKELDSETLAKASPFIKALSQFGAVVEACFGQTLDPNYTNLIKDFMLTYRSLQISIPLKVIIIIYYYY